MQKQRSRRSRAGGSLRQELLSLYQRSKANNSPDADASLVRLREALKSEKDNGIDGQLLGMAAAQCARIGDGRPVGLLLAFAAPRLDSCGSRAVVELAQAAHKLGCMDPGFLRATMTYFASEECQFASLRDAAMAATVLLQSVRGDSMVNHEGALRGIAEAVRPLLFDTSPLQRKSATQAVRDCVELCHALAHSLCQVSLGAAELASVEAALAGALRLVRRELHAGCARDAAMLGGAAAAAWPHMPSLQESLLWPCLGDVGQLARFRGDDFSLQDLCIVAAAFAKVARSDDIFASVLELRVVPNLETVCNRDLSFLLWAAACVPGWSVTIFANAALEQILQRPKARMSAKDLCTLVQSLVKIRESNPKARGVLQAVAEEGLSRDGAQFSEEDRSCMLWALRATQATGGTAADDSMEKRPMKTAEEQRDGSSGEENRQGKQHPLSSKTRQRRGGKKERAQDEASRGDGAEVAAEEKEKALAGSVSGENKRERFCPPCSSPIRTPELVPAGVVGLSLFDSLPLPPGINDKNKQCSWVHGHGGNLSSHGHGPSHGGNHGYWLPLSNFGAAIASSSHDYHGQGHIADSCSDGHQHHHDSGGHEGAHQHDHQTAVCEDQECCPSFSGDNDGSKVEVRLNAHCSFSGHCVKMKNTFIHIPCNSFSDSDSDGDCAVCAFTRVRAKSCDDAVHGRRKLGSSDSKDSDGREEEEAQDKESSAAYDGPLQ